MFKRPSLIVIFSALLIAYSSPARMAANETSAKRVPDISFIIDSFLFRNKIQWDEFFEGVATNAIGLLGH